jgi:hypothetical protein
MILGKEFEMKYLEKTLKYNDDFIFSFTLIPNGEFLPGIEKPLPPTGTYWKGIFFVVISLIGIYFSKIFNKNFSLLQFIFFCFFSGFGIFGVFYLILVKKNWSYFDISKNLYDKTDYNQKNMNRVFIENSFFLGQTEITQRQFKAVMGFNPSSVIGEEFPVHNVELDEAQRFCKKISPFLGEEIRLPTELEWEYACKINFSISGIASFSEFLDAHGWYKKNSGNSLHQISRKGKTCLNLFDMNGNVWEWCCPAYSFRDKNLLVTPASLVDVETKYTILKGGMFSSEENQCKPSFRQLEKIPLSALILARKNNFYGFRICFSSCVSPQKK